MTMSIGNSKEETPFYLPLRSTGEIKGINIKDHKACFVV